MNKKEVQKRVLQNGEQLALDKFEWDEKAEVFSTTESNLVLDFKDVNCVTFTTGSDCTFTTGSYCTFTTGYQCVITTGYQCVITTGSDCVITTGHDCTFTTGFHCVITTGSDCVITTGFSCVVIRRDVYEVIELKEGVKIMLNGSGIKGYKEIPDESEDVEIIVDGKTTIISRKSAIALGLVK